MKKKIFYEIRNNLNLTLEEEAWVKEQASNFLLNPSIVNLYNYVKNNNSSEAKNWAKGQIELGTIADKFSEIDPIKIILRYNPGKINGRDDQKYTHTATDGIRAYHKMEDGSIVISSAIELELNSNGNVASRFTSESGNDKYYYINL